MSRPIFDINPEKTRFEDGDRVLVKCASDLGQDQITKLSRTIRKWSGKQVQILVANPYTVSMVLARDGQITDICSPDKVPLSGLQMGVASLKCSKLQFFAGDRLTVSLRANVPRIHIARFRECVKEWVSDPDVELVFLCIN